MQPVYNAAPLVSGDAAIARARTLSRYFDRTLTAHPAALPSAEVGVPLTAVALAEAAAGLAAAADEAALKSGLRALRRRVMLRVIARDLAGLATLDEVVATVSALADSTVGAAADWLERDLTARHGTPRGETGGAPQQLHVVAMGKMGGCELNPSSDIDLVMVYPEEGQTDGPRPLTNHEFFVRLAQRLTGVLSEITPDGFVFRVDNRLRPWGDAGPLAAGFEALEDYLITYGREWERFAWLKARAVRGDRSAELMDIVRPFVFRRHLDYSAIAALRALHRQIREEVARRDRADDIKIGPGGIREIEFIVQLFQLIRGGREPELRARGTREALRALSARELLPAEVVEALAAAYVFLRNLEHRLQYLDDQQTQRLPRADDDRACVATAMNLPDWTALAVALDAQRAVVSAQFDRVFAEAPEHGEAAVLPLARAPDAETAAAHLSALGYADPAALLAEWNRLRTSSRIRAMPATSQSLLERLVPLALVAGARQPQPDLAITRLLRLLEAIARRESYLALLVEFPQALETLARLVGASPWVADYLSRHPILLDELLDGRALHAAPDWPRLAAALRAQLDALDPDVEQQMDALRHFKQQQTIRLIAQDLAGELALEKLSDHLTDLADLILRETLCRCWAGLKTRHCTEPRFAVIGYGKLGGKELGYASDLDIVFLYADDAPEAWEHYARLAQRISAWLTTITPGGVLYETDLQLRPDGGKGLLVSTVESFATYQHKSAWTWEHQALTRARWCAGDAAIGAAFEAIRREVLTQPRDAGALAREVVAMREKMLAAHPNASGLFDLKHDRGGIIDVEFAVQYLVLAHAHRHPALTGNVGNLALLKLAATLRLLPMEVAGAAHDAYREFRRRQHALRLQGGEYARVEKPAAAAHVAAVERLWREVFGNSAR